MSPIHVDVDDLENMVSAQSSSMEVDIPPILQASVRRHQANLARLLESFRAAGLDEAQIDDAVSVVIDSYKHELLQAIRTLTAPDHTAEDTR